MLACQLKSGNQVVEPVWIGITIGIGIGHDFSFGGIHPNISGNAEPTVDLIGQTDVFVLVADFFGAVI
jgi:hypothetical protein